MDHYSRFVGLAFVIAWTIFRLVRYLKAGTSKRPPPAVPPEAPSPAAMTGSPIEPVAAGSLRGALLAVLVWLLGNAAIWAALFLLPPLEAVPVVPRLVIGVLANFYLLYLARRAAAWSRQQSGQAPPAGGNPIS